MSAKQTREDAAARKRAERQRLRDAGLIAVTVHVRPEHRSQIQDFARWLVESKG